MLSGTLKRDTFDLFAGQGSQIITNFTVGAGGDLLQLMDYGFASFAAVMNATKQVGADTVISLGAGETLTLKNVQASSLTAANVSFNQNLPTSGSSSNWIIAAANATTTGTSANDAISASGGNKILAGGKGDDVYQVDDSSVQIVENGGEGIDTVKSWASFSLAIGQSIENLTLLGTVNTSATGNELDNIVTGNTGNNVLTGGLGNDTLTGGGGNDVFVVRPGDGSDVVTDFGAKGVGADVLRIENYGYASFDDIKSKIAQVGSNTVIRLSDTDTIILRNVVASDLSAANFQFLSINTSRTLVGTDGNDTLAGGNASDTITGGKGSDTMTGGAGSDVFVLSKGDGADTVTDFQAGTGGDVLRLQNYGITSWAAFQAALKQVGPDTVISLGGTDTLTLKNVTATQLTQANLAFDHTLAASGGQSHWFTMGVAGSIDGTSGNDLLSTNIAGVTLRGGAGDDTYNVVSGDIVVENAGGGVDTIQSWATTYTIASGQEIENLVLMSSASSGFGNELDNRIIGNAAANVLGGGLGNDVLTGGGGKDTFIMTAGGGLDVITDFAAKGSDADTIQIEGYSYASFNDLKARIMQVGADTMIWLSDRDAITLKNISASDLSSVNFLFVPAPGRTIVGTDAGEILAGGAGADMITGGKGNDTISGGAGRDTFVSSKGDGSDTITDFAAGAQGDVLKLQNYGFADFAAFQKVLKQVGADTVVTLGGGETLTLKGVTATALTADNVSLDLVLAVSAGTTNWLQTSVTGVLLSGTNGNDQLSTNAMGVTLKGGLGDDVYHVMVGDTVVENAGQGIDTIHAWVPESYVLPANVENLVLENGNVSSWGMGNDLNNMIIGNGGNNTLIGGKGNDILTGNGGSDLFVVGKGDGSDVITDFAVNGAGRDMIRLDGLGFKTFADIKAALSQSGADTIVSLGDGATLTLKNVKATDLTAANFALPVDKSSLIQTFSDDFNSFNRVVNGQGTWSTKYIFGGVNSYMLNDEQQLYVDQDFKGLPGSLSSSSLGINPFSVENGELVITAKPFDPSVQKYVGNAGYSSGVITTQTSFYQTYGYFEITAELPHVQGAWPAFWMLQNDKWPPELDVFEYLGSRDDSLTSGVRSNTGDQMRWQWAEDLTSGAHKFATLWTPYGIDIYIDNVLTAHYSTPDDMNGPMYLIANLAMGGSWGGSPAANAVAQMKIDSVQVYQLPEYTLAGYTLKQSAAAVNTINGTGAAETIVGTDQADRIDGKGGADTLSGGYGDDTYIVSVAGTKVVEGLGQGIDTVMSSVTFTLGANVENLVLTGTANIDATGNDGANIISGNAGNNVITGGLGSDVLTGGGGNDTFVIAKGDGSDILTDFSAGAGAGDVVKLTGFWFNSFADVKSVMTEVGNDVYLKLDDLETLVFRNHHISDFAADDFQLPSSPPVSAAPIHWITETTPGESLYGTPSNEALQGNGRLAGGDGDDTYTVGPNTVVVEGLNEGVDTVISWLPTYTLTANVENLVLMQSGSTGNGNELVNRITGTAGNDTLNGKGGNDWLTGGGGKDSFAFDKPGTGVVTITDFAPSDDKILLSGVGFKGLGNAGALNASMFVSGTAAKDVNDFIIYDKSTGNIFYDADGNGSAAAVQFAHINPGLDLNAGHFLVV